jgi:hypothetical protein
MPQPNHPLSAIHRQYPYNSTSKLSFTFPEIPTFTKKKSMKRIIAFACFSFVTMVSQAQEATTDPRDGNNDVKINVLYGVLETLELEYERIINDNAGVGMAVNYWFNDDSDLSFMAIPYFRFYPSEKHHGAGFFIEANLGVIGSKNFDYTYDGTGIETRTEKDLVSMGAGVAVGGKFMSKSGFFGEVFGGVGREFNDESYIEVYPRAGITLGKRFGQ